MNPIDTANRGRPAGAKTIDRPDVHEIPSRCPRCECTRRASFTGPPINVEGPLTHPETGDWFQRKIGRRTQCASCGQFRMQWEYEDTVAIGGDAYAPPPHFLTLFTEKEFDMISYDDLKLKRTVVERYNGRDYVCVACICEGEDCDLWLAIDASTDFEKGPALSVLIPLPAAQRDSAAAAETVKPPADSDSDKPDAKPPAKSEKKTASGKEAADKKPASKRPGKKKTPRKKSKKKTA